MGLLDSFERGIERAFNGAFARTFRSGVQPVEIASALRSELDARAAIVSRERTLAPNSFVVSLSEDDYDNMRSLGQPLEDELVLALSKHAKEQGYTLPGPILIQLQPSAEVQLGMIQVSSSSPQQVSWDAVVEISGTRHRLKRGRNVLGRGTQCDITIPDTGASREHFEILWDGERAMVRDLRSTNGTKLGGQTVKEAPLESGAVISVGRSNIVFRVIANSDRSHAGGF